MSIQLRLTLLYTAILAATLVAFGALLYTYQARETLEIEKQALIAAGERMARVPLGRPVPAPSEPPAEFADRYLVRRSPDGEEILDVRAPDDRILPFGNEALQAAQKGETWMEVATVDGERLLIYTVPIVVEGQLAEILQTGHSLATRDAGLRALGTGLLVGGLAAILVAFGLGWVLAGMAMRPIQRLTDTAQAIGAEHDFSRRVAHTGPDDEVGRLAKTLNAMLSELQAAYQQVEQALEMQRRFVADVSHELRTPLTTLSGNVELLRREPPISAEDRTEVLADMSSESKRLIRLVNDLLTLARADARQPLQSEPVQIGRVVEDVCRQARLRAPDRVITCNALLDVAVSGQADALKQVLLILLDNAIKHTDGAITVATRVADERVIVSIHDTGPGIEPELLPRIFERFSRGKTMRADGRIAADEGIGLGLAIAKELVAAQSGTLTVESQVGQGSVFTVTLPQAAVSREAR
jgi:two-component system OmpR family sensor kinase